MQPLTHLGIQCYVHLDKDRHNYIQNNSCFKTSELLKLANKLVSITSSSGAIFKNNLNDISILKRPHQKNKRTEKFSYLLNSVSFLEKMKKERLVLVQ